MSDNARLFIAVACHERRRITEQCLPTLRAGAAPDDTIGLYNDGSKEFDDAWLRQFSNRVIGSPKSIGIEAQRRQHLKDFWADKRFTHLYFSDADALVDPTFRENLLRVQEEYGGALVCGYNTDAHVRIEGNTFNDSPHNEVVWRRVAPGISYLLSRVHVAAIMKFIDRITNFDWQIPGILGNRCAITRISYVDHIGAHGLHWKPEHGLEGGDRALNPTDFLVKKRTEVVAALS